VVLILLQIFSPRNASNQSSPLKLTFSTADSEQGFLAGRLDWRCRVEWCMWAGFDVSLTFSLLSMGA